jgi:glycosyltransferase involved in cell wall biosynthesis
MKKDIEKSYTVSVILILHKDPPQIGSVIKCIKEQTYDQKKIRIICLDDGTSPKSQKILTESGVELCELPYNSSISYAKNYALKASKDNLIFYLDDRLSLDKNAIKEAVEVFKKHPEIAGVCGYYSASNLSDWNILRDIKRESIYGKANKEREITLNNFTTFSTGICMIKRQIIEEFPFPEDDFPNDFGGEDIPVMLAALNKGHKFIYSPKLWGYHEHNLTFYDFLKKIEIEVRGRFSLLYWASDHPEIKVPYLHGFLNFPLLLVLMIVLSLSFAGISRWFLLLPIFPLVYETYLSFQCFNTPMNRPFIYKLKASIFVLCSDLLSVVCWLQYLVSGYKRPFKKLNLQQFLNINKIYIYWELEKYGIRK